MSEKPRLLMVDDEKNILSSFRRSLGRSYELTLCEGGAEALAVLRSEMEFPVIVTDMRMPGMDGVEFVRQARQIHANSVYVMLTGNADQQTAIDAINKGQVFRFLNKPCTHEIVECTLDASFRQYELIQTERTLLRQTLSGSIRLLVDALTVADPEIGAATQSVRLTVRQVTAEMGMQESWQLPVAASLAFLGSIALPASPGKAELTDSYLLDMARVGSELLRHIPRMQDVARTVLMQRETGTIPDPEEGDSEGYRAEFGGRMLRFAIDWYRASLGTNGDRAKAFHTLEKSSSIYDPRFISAARSLLSKKSAGAEHDQAITRRSVSLRELRSGDIVDENITTKNKVLLIRSGQELSQTMIQRILAFDRAGLLDVGQIPVRSGGS